MFDNNNNNKYSVAITFPCSNGTGPPVSVLKRISMFSKDFVCTGTYSMLLNVFVMTSPDFPLTAMVLSRGMLVFPTIAVEQYRNKQKWMRYHANQTGRDFLTIFGP